MKKKFNKKLIAPLILVIFGLFLAWPLTIAVQKTSDVNFCASCHSMQPIAKSYLASKHGGNNQTGFRAKCTDCHLPQNGPINHLYQKAKMSINDIFVESFYNTDDIDWEEKRANREKFTYDSGCTKCHQNFEVIHKRDKHAQDAHDYYNANKDKHSCTLCHKNVGHHNLSEYLPK